MKAHNILGRLLATWNSLWFRKRVESELEEELAAHIALREAEWKRRGASEPEAARLARLEFGGRAKYQEECRESLAGRLLGDLRADLTYGVRMLRRSPLLTAALLACLAAGIGAACATFNVTNAVLLKALPVRDPGQLFSLRWDEKKDVPDGIRAYGTGYGDVCFPYQTYLALRDQAAKLEKLGITGTLAYAPIGFLEPNVKIVRNGQPSMASGELVSGDYFPTLGARTVIGRPIANDDLSMDAPLVVVLSNRYWHDAFGGDTNAVGSKISLNGLPATVIGVAQPHFNGLNPQAPAELWAPLRGDRALFPWGATPAASQTLGSTPGWWWLPIFVRTRPGMTAQQADRILTPVFRQSITAHLQKRFKADDLPFVKSGSAAGGLDFLRSNLSVQLYVLLGAVGLLLLIGCVNVATLLLARASTRGREMSIRLATGASRGRIVRQVVTESLLLSLAGGALGVLLAFWASRLLLVLVSGSETAGALDLRFDSRVMAFALGVSLLTGILFGMAPALRSLKAEPFPALKETRAIARTRFAGPLVALQVALSLLLLIASGLFIRTLANLEDQPLGFESRRLLIFALDPRSDGFRDVRLLHFYNQAMQKLNALPGVRSASVAAFALLSGWSSNGAIATDASPRGKGDSTQVIWNNVGANYLRTMGIGLVSGRDLSEADMESGRRVAIVNETLARKFFPHSNPLHRRFSFGESYDGVKAWEIVGVSKYARFGGLRSKKRSPMAYISYAGDDPAGLARMTVAVSTRGNPLGMIAAVRSALHSLDPQLPLIEPQTQTDLLNKSLRHENVFAQLSSVFALLAVGLGAIGLYGNLAYSVSQRSGEIGVRMALGAVPRQVIWLVLRTSLQVVALGVVGGCLLAWGSTRIIAASLFGVKPMDASVIAWSVLVLLLASALATILPARRAAGIDPASALRHE